MISGHPLLISAAVEAVRQWIYRPTLLNGEAVEVIAPIDVHFTLGSVVLRSAYRTIMASTANRIDCESDQMPDVMPQVVHCVGPIARPKQARPEIPGNTRADECHQKTQRRRSERAAGQHEDLHRHHGSGTSAETKNA